MLASSPSGPASYGVERPPGPTGRSWASEVWPVLIVAAVLVASFVVVYPLRGFRVPLGSDTPVYEWWARRAQAFGLAATDTGGRPAVVGALASLEAFLPSGMGATAAALGPVLAAIAALAAGSLVVVSMKADRRAFVLTAGLSGAFLSTLVAGYLSTLAFAALFLAALACLTGSLDGQPAGTVAAALLGGAAALSHPIFMVVAGLVVGGGALAVAPSFRQDLRSGRPRLGTALGRVGLVAGGALTILAAGTVAGGLRVAETIDTSRDAFLLRVGLGALIERSYRAVLGHIFTWWRSLVIVASAALGAPRLVGPRRSEAQPRDDRRRWFGGLMVAWLMVTAGGLVALLAGFRVPGQRLAQFAMPLPILAALGFGRLRSDLPSPLGRAAMLMATAAYAVVMWSAWWDVTPLVPAEALAQSQTVARLAAAAPSGTPIVVVADDMSGSPARTLIRSFNYLRAELPPDRLLDAHLFVGDPRGFQEREPSIIGRPEHDLLSLDAWATLRPALGGTVVAVVIRAFDPGGYREAIRLPGAAKLGPGVAILPGSFTSTSSPDRGTISDEGAPGIGPISPWQPVWLALGILALLAILGGPAAFIALRRAPLVLRAGLTPAFGLAILGLASIVVDAAGFRSSGVPAAVLGGVLVPGAYLVWRSTASVRSGSSRGSRSVAEEGQQAAHGPGRIDGLGDGPNHHDPSRPRVDDSG